MPGEQAFGGGVPPDARWLDEDAGPLVRSFALTGGRARPAGGAAFDLLAYVVTTAPPDALTRRLPPEQRAILRRAEQPISVAELASAVDLPLGVVRVLLGDLVAQSAITIHAPDSTEFLPEDDVLEAVIHALRTL